MTSPVIFSVAIPAHNEAHYLPRLLDSIEAARRAYRGDPAAIEVIVADNGSTDATAEIARARGCTVVTVAKRAIAAARNGAARAARGGILCFIDADSVLHPATFNEVGRVMQTGRCVVGATGVWMDRWSAGIGLTWLLLVPLTRIFGVDAGVVFCRRADFETVGGYCEGRLVAEDLDFLFRLKRLGRQRGQRFMRANAAKAVTSTRKFDRHGDWHWFTKPLALPFQLLFRRQTLHQAIWTYWYEDRNG